MATTKDFTLRRGDGWPGFSFRPSVNGVYLTNLAVATIRMQWRSFPDGPLLHGITLGSGLVVEIRNGSEEWIVAQRQALPLDSGSYVHEAEIIQDGDTWPDTIIDGKTTVIADVARTT